MKTLRPTIFLPFLALLGNYGCSGCDDQNVSRGGGLQNLAPTIFQVEIPRGLYRAGNTIPVEVIGARDEDGDPVTIRYEWYLNEAKLEGESQPFLEAGIAVRDNTVKVAVIPNDGHVDGEPVFSNAITVANTPPTTPEVRLGPVPVTFAAKALQAEILTPAIDADGDPIIYRHTWYQNNSVRAADPESAIVPVTTKPGDEWRLQVVAFDGHAYSGLVESKTRIPDFVMASPGHILNSHAQSGVESETAAGNSTVSAGAVAADGLAQSAPEMSSNAYRFESRYDE